MGADCVIFFVKYPEKGKVKTRLSAELDEEITVELYRNFILDLLSMLEKLGIDFQIHFSPADSRENFVEWLGDSYSFVPQQGEDLGQRMKNGLVQSFAQGYDRAVIIGSDSPDLPGGLVSEAFSSLETCDAVVGPSPDGGYYLIGFRISTFLPEAFEGIEWSTDTVFRKTIEVMDEQGLRVHVLQEWQDVDTLIDLVNLVQRNRDCEFRCSRTMSIIPGKIRMLMWKPDEKLV